MAEAGTPGPGGVSGQAGGDMGAPAPSIRPGARPFKPPSSKRQQITAAEAIDIYKLRPVPGELRRPRPAHFPCAATRCTPAPASPPRRACCWALTKSAPRVGRQRWAAPARQHAALQVDCSQVRRDAQDHPRRLEWPLLGKDDPVCVLRPSLSPTRSCPLAPTARLKRAVAALQ